MSVISFYPHSIVFSRISFYQKVKKPYQMHPLTLILIQHILLEYFNMNKKYKWNNSKQENIVSHNLWGYK